MAYIGKTPVIGNFVKLDAISVVDGQAAYTMQNGGVNFTSYDNVNQFLVSLNGILQSPTDSFTVSGSTLTFASNLSTGDVIDFVMVLGNTLDIGTPSDNTITTAKLSNNAVTNAKLSFNANQYRNIIINGDMSIAQRGTSVTGVTSTGYQSLDRFDYNIGTAGTWTISQSTDVPTGQGFAKSMKLDCTTANSSLSSGSKFFMRQKIEGQNVQYIKKGTSSAESLTLSFWVKSNKTGTYIAEIFDNDNSRQISTAYTISSANTWEKKTITYAGDTSGTLDNDNNVSLQVSFFLVAGTDFSSGTLSTTWTSSTNANRAVGQVNLADSTANEWYITGVQLEVGSAASDFEFLPYDVNLQRCQRYFEQIVSPSAFNIYWSGYTDSNYDDTSPYSFKVEKRTVPSASATSGFTFSNINGSEFDFAQKNKSSINFIWTTNGAGRYYVYSGSGDKIKFDAEL